MSRAIRNIFVFCFTVAWFSAATIASAGEAGKAIFVYGTVTVERPQSADLKKGDAVLEGDVIVTGERSRAQLMMKDGAKLALKPGTRLVIDEYFEVGDEVPAPGGAVVVSDKGSSVTTLIKGGFRTITGAIAEAEPDAYEARTPVATLGIRGTDFSVVYCNTVTSPCTTPSGEKGPDDGLYVGVASGAVEMNNSAGGLVLGAGEYGAVESEDTPPKKLPGPPPAVYANEAVGGEEDEESEEEAAEEEAVAADESSEGDGEAATEEAVVAAGESSEGDGQAASEEEAVAAGETSEGDGQAATEEAVVAAGESSEGDGQAATEEAVVAAGETSAGDGQAATEEAVVAVGESSAGDGQAATEEAVVAVGESSAGVGQAATEEALVAVGESSAGDGQAASEEEVVASQDSTASSEQAPGGSAVAATGTSTDSGQAAGGDASAIATFESDISVSVVPISPVNLPSPNPAPITVAVVSVQTSTADVGSPDTEVAVSEPPVIEVVAEDESGNPVDLDTGTPVDPVSGDPIAADFRDVTFATGPLLQDLGFTGVSSNPEGTIVLGSTGDDLTTFAGPSPGDPAALGTTYAVGTAVNLNVGFDPISGMRWGRWSEGSATVVPPGANSSPLPLADQSLHWVIGPLSSAPPVIPQGGSATYDVIAGNTDPTDNLGNVGVLGSANLLADFTNQTVATDVLVSIAGSIWSGNGTSALNGHLFDGAFATVLIDNSPGAGGRFSGFFSGLNQAAGGSPTGAGLSYEMESFEGNVVTGIVVFGPPRP